jgi:allophanate hydrolase subunit 1
MSGAITEVTLRALEGQPLEDLRVRDMVEATARAIAERQGVEVLDLHAAPDRITVTLKTGRIESLGFAAELRRLTTRWYTQKFGERTLWGEPLEEGEEWKRK